MGDDVTNTTEAPTRRDYMKYGGAVIGGGLLAGCAGQSDSSGTPEATNTETATSAETDTENETTSTSEKPDSWTASLPPVGELEFEAVPEGIFDAEGFVADVVTALGHGDTVQAFSSGKWPRYFYDELPGVDVVEGSIPTFNDGAVDKEVFYELDPDLITIDPNMAMAWDGLDSADLDELTSNVAPFFGQRARGPRAAEGFYQYDGETQYRYYDLYEQTEIYGQVFQEQERATAINEANRSLVQEVQERLPPEEDRPTVAVGGLWSGTYWASVIYFDVTTPEVVHNGKIRTYSKKQYRETGVVNAFPDENFGEDGPFFLQTDTEGLLKANPDVMFVDNAVNDQEFFEEQVRTLQDDPVASEVAAVQNDRIYPGGTPTQGPIVNMFQTEMVAKQLYPEEFGEWHGLGDVPDGEQLFDRQRVADIVNGNT